MTSIQYDEKVRVVSLDNLKAMCDRVSSGMCHNFGISQVSKTRVYVDYSNPDEYGNDHPMTAVFPLYRWTPWKDSVLVVMDIINIIHDNWHGEGWQAFQPLLDCPKLWRNSIDGEDWRTREEWTKAEIEPDADDKERGAKNTEPDDPDDLPDEPDEIDEED